VHPQSYDFKLLQIVCFIVYAQFHQTLIPPNPKKTLRPILLSTSPPTMVWRTCACEFAKPQYIFLEMTRYQLQYIKTSTFSTPERKTHLQKIPRKNMHKHIIFSTSRTFLDFNLNLLANVCRLHFNLQELNLCFPQNRHRNSCTAAVPPLSFPRRGMKNTKNRGPKEKSRGLKEKNRSRQEEEGQE
jgi:hypothetical protein